MIAWLALLLLVTLPTVAGAQIIPGPGVIVENGGTPLGRAGTINCDTGCTFTLVGAVADLVVPVIEVESGFNPSARSPKNAQGLMQLIPETAERFGVNNVWDPEQNLRGGMAYLKWLMSHFSEDLELVLAAYNAGEGAVERYLGVPPFAETRNYVRKITAAMGGRRMLPFDATVTAPSQQLVLMRPLQAAR